MKILVYNVRYIIANCIFIKICKGTLYQNSKGGNGLGSYEELGACV